MWRNDGQYRITVVNEDDCLAGWELGYNSVSVHDVRHHWTELYACNILAFRESKPPNRVKIFKNDRSFSDELAAAIVDGFFPIEIIFTIFSPDSSYRFELLDL